MGTLVQAHGDDVQAMVRDMKRNAMQHTAGVRARVAACGRCTEPVLRIACALLALRWADTRPRRR
jgi:hypothetical protein